jgi:hypothetical protein
VSKVETELPLPRQVKQYRKLLLEKCLGSMKRSTSISVTAEGMDALTKILAELREGDVGSSLEAISEQCRVCFDNVSLDECLCVSSIAITNYVAYGSGGQEAMNMAPASGEGLLATSCGKHASLDLSLLINHCSHCGVPPHDLI